MIVAPGFPQVHTGNEMPREVKGRESILVKPSRFLYIGKMFKDAFTKLDRKKTGPLFDLIAPKLEGVFDRERVQIMIHDLNFYPGHFLTEITSHDHHPPLIRHAICNDKGDVVVLDWTTAPIYTLNKKVPLLLNEKTIENYMRFFFAYTRGRHGRFLIIDSVDDIDWREEPAPAGRKAIAKMIEPLRLAEVEKGGDTVFVMSMIFKDSLFQAKARLSRDGTISVYDEEIVVEDLPIADDFFGE